MDTTKLQSAARTFGRTPAYCQMLSALRNRHTWLIPGKGRWQVIGAKETDTFSSFPDDLINEALAGGHMHVLDRDEKGIVTKVALTPGGQDLAMRFIETLKGLNAPDLGMALLKAVEQIGDESLVGAVYEESDLIEQLRAALARQNLDYDALAQDSQQNALQRAKDRLEEEWGLVCTIEEE